MGSLNLRVAGWISGLLLSFFFFISPTTAQEPPPAESESSKPSATSSGEESTSLDSGSEETGKGQPPERVYKVVEVEVRGNQIISTNTILSKMKLRKGETLVQETINDYINRLYATDFFQEIQMEIEERADGYKLIVVVTEKPIVREIIFEGATVFKEDKLRKELKILEGQILDRKAVKEGVEAIRKLYGDKAFRFVDIQSEVNVNPATKEATVRIKIAEGKKYKIKSVDFEGVKAFKPKKLRRLMRTKAKGLLRSGVFKESFFQQDLERVRLFYQQEGYLDVKVDADFDYKPQEQRIFIRILVEEGQHYVTGEVKIQGNQLFPESEIWQELEMLPGLTYSQYYLSKDVQPLFLAII